MKATELNPTVEMGCGMETMVEKCRKAANKFIETYKGFCKFVKPMYVYEEA